MLAASVQDVRLGGYFAVLTGGDRTTSPTSTMAHPDRHSAAIEEFGGDPGDFANILGAASNSLKLIDQARRSLSSVDVSEGIAALAVGSLGRLEALEASDVDFSLLYDSARTKREDARRAREEMCIVLIDAK